MTDLARRAVACRHWRWMPGMLVRYGDGKAAQTPIDKYLTPFLGGWYRLTNGDGYGMPFKHVPPNPRDAWPDLTDPATLGCLLALVREAWGSQEMVTKRGWDFPTECWVWSVRTEPRPVAAIGEKPGHPSTWRTMSIGGGPTEAEALIAALEAAP
jgi:hypothetical protein